MTRNLKRWKCRGGRALALAAGLGLLVLGSAASGQVPDLFKSAGFHSTTRERQANHLLPAHVQAPDGELTLFADFSHAGDGRIPIYIVNRTREPVTFASEDGALYLKLETPGPDGAWQRAQAHRFPDCGNSYYPTTLPAGQFWLLAGYQPAAGRRTPVRFALYDDAQRASPIAVRVSNAGEGLVGEADLAAANQDDLTSRRIPFAAAWWLRAGDAGVDPARSTPWADRVATLRLVTWWEENGYFRARAQELGARARADASPEGRAAAQAIAAFLATPWPRTADPAAFLQRCIAELRAPAGPRAEFGAPGANPALLWPVLSEVATAGFGSGRSSVGAVATMSTALWREIVDTAQRRIDTTPGYGITALLGIPVLADEFVADRFFEERLGSAKREVRNMAAEALGRRARFARLVALGQALPPDLRLEVLAALAGGGQAEGKPWAGTSRFRYPQAGAEIAFWVACVRERPLAAMATLENADAYDRGEHDFPREIEAVVRLFLRAEAAKAAGDTADFLLPQSGEIPQALRFLAHRRSWHYEPAVLEQLLRHRGYCDWGTQEESDGRRWAIRTYPFRAFALEELKKMDRMPREPIQVEERFPLPSR